MHWPVDDERGQEKDGSFKILSTAEYPDCAGYSDLAGDSVLPWRLCQQSVSYLRKPQLSLSIRGRRRFTELGIPAFIQQLKFIQFTEEGHHDEEEV
jgi:hypothetical protein